MIGSFRKLLLDTDVRTISAMGVGLVLIIFIGGCSPASESSTISITWKEDLAVGWTLPLSSLGNTFTEEDILAIITHLMGHPLQVLGDYESSGGKLTFHPLIPFTPGLKYEVLYHDHRLAIIDIPTKSTPDPSIISIYPTQDTVPENLLKFYLDFSKPMQAGEVLQYLRLINDQGDTLSDVFMDLQTELWNSDQTQLTLWMQPGRIKRGLQPNLTLGPPLLEGHQYQLLIKRDWQDTEGKSLGHSYSKSFYVDKRDSLSPVINHWEILQEPDHGPHTITIVFHEVLDHELLYHCFSILDAGGIELKGLFTPNETATELVFSSGKKLTSGKYRLRIESRQEDLAGNNLNRLFDTDLTARPKQEKEVYYKSFSLDVPPR